MLFADQVFTRVEVDAVLKRDYAPTMFFKAHDAFMRSVVQTSEKAYTLLDEIEDWERDEGIYRLFAKAARAPKIYTMGGKSKPTDAFGEETPIGWSFDYWLRLYENVKDASLDFALDIGQKNGRLPLIESQDFQGELMDLGYRTGRLYQGYMDVMGANDYFRSIDKNDDDAADLVKYAERMMSGVYVMLNHQTGLPMPTPDTDEDADAAYEPAAKRQLARRPSAWN